MTQFVITPERLWETEFDASLHERLRDQLVIGISNDPWQQELFTQQIT